MLRKAPAPHPALVWAAAWPVTAVFTLSNAATPLYPAWRARMGLSAGTMTLVFAAYIAALVASLLVAGVAADRLGRRRVLLPALGLALIAAALFGTAPSVAALIAARLLSGAAVGAAVSAGMAAVTDAAAPGRERRAALAASAAMVLGAGTGPLLAGLLGERVFWLELALLASAVAVVLRLPARPGHGGTGSWIRVPRVPAGNRGRLAAGIGVFGPGITATSFVLSLMPSLLADLLGSADRLLAGGIAFATFGTATAVQFAVRGRAARTVLLLGAAATSAAMLALLAAVGLRSVTALLAAGLLAGAGQGLGQLGGLSLLNAHVPAARLAEANAALNIGGYLPAGTLPVATGYLGDAAGLPAAVTVFAAAVLALALAWPLLGARTLRD
ncbi:MFS transporter [Actinomadura parmotrematis]|uniref:MFS transporter n=1 Tax=Actinomadura parmotrematis TaxID=2864039 RepID=A0ABS7FRM3_9ACTN|nr:MFS transporter [Actinomadura parmotrematis]MBW8483043.1 MFS transporter [Actinomadura parmotrematis]